MAEPKLTKDDKLQLQRALAVQMKTLEALKTRAEAEAQHGAAAEIQKGIDGLKDLETKLL